MRFVDEVEITVISGDGGNGCVSFRREKFIPKGGPDGGDGGRGGNVYFKVNSHLNTLMHFRGKRLYRAESGLAGSGQQKNGHGGADLYLEVPLGTCLINPDSGHILKEFIDPEEVFLVAQGGRGGLGNINFKGPINQTPRFATDGKPGQTLQLKLELKLMADIGLVGLPNAGKSTLISVISKAKPKIADYPFTTLTPQLGVVERPDLSYVVADIPGLIQGAHLGKGLGTKFLRHIDRTKILVHLIDLSEIEEPFDAFSNYVDIRDELVSFRESLGEKKEIIALTKIDAVDDEHLDSIKKIFEENLGKRVLPISSVSGKNIDELLHILDKAFLSSLEVTHQAQKSEGNDHGK
jgi:GTP-binding protein